MPIPNDYQEIIKEIADATRENRLNWTVDKKNISQSISTDINGTIFKLWSGVDGETNIDFVSLAISDQTTGAPLDNWYVDYGDKDYSKMQEIYSSALRQARGISQRLSSILDVMRKSN